MSSVRRTRAFDARAVADAEGPGLDALFMQAAVAAGTAGLKALGRFVGPRNAAGPCVAKRLRVVLVELLEAITRVPARVRDPDSQILGGIEQIEQVPIVREAVGATESGTRVDRTPHGVVEQGAVMDLDADDVSTHANRVAAFDFTYR